MAPEVAGSNPSIHPFNIQLFFMSYSYPNSLNTIFNSNFSFTCPQSVNLPTLNNTNFLDSMYLVESILTPTFELDFTLALSFSEASITLFDVTEQLLRSRSKFNLLPAELQAYDVVTNPLKLNHEQFIELINEVDAIDDFETISNIRSTYLNTIPNVKLFYPEAFIASPSFIHTDLGFLHILQYQFWLWFVFIFLIVFFFVTFLCTVRWCSLRNQPRRETRGVSRSKCGDLITATVPVTWALSIIVSESTDATDYYDGFGTGELIVGVRAYQWGWEYYYPKNIDLNYNLKPSYSTFIGNSLRYNPATEKTCNSKNIWRFYQNKLDDSTITPAHLLVLPLDNAKLINFMDFNDIGANPLRDSSSFKKIRMFSKTYTTNLVHTPSTFTDKYIKLNSLYFNENDLTNSLNYGLKRQHNLTSLSATTNTYSNYLDYQSANKFLQYNLQYNQPSSQTNLFNQELNLLIKDIKNSTNSGIINTLNSLINNSTSFDDQALKFILAYPSITQFIGDNSDKKSSKYPIRKLLNPKLGDKTVHSIHNNSYYSNFNSLMTTSHARDYAITTLPNDLELKKIDQLNSFNRGFSLTDRHVRMTKKTLPKSHVTNLNLSLGLNSLDSNNNLFNTTFVSTNPSNYYTLSKTNWIDIAIFTKLASNRVRINPTLPSNMSSNPHYNKLHFDTPLSKSYSTKFINNTVKTEIKYSSDKTSNLISGAREQALPALSTTYWDTFWRSTNVDPRILSSLNASQNPELFYLPIFTNYFDYDFQNAQAFEMLEDLVWESTYSAYNHLDYKNIFNNATAKVDLSCPYWIAESSFAEEDFEYQITQIPLINSAFKDVSLSGRYYANQVQFDDVISPTTLINTKDFSLFPLLNDSLLIDDSYINAIFNKILLNTYSNAVLNVGYHFNTPQSYMSVLNNFRADFDDFTVFIDNDFDANTNFIDTNAIDADSLIETSNQTLTNAIRVSNPLTLRSTAKNSITNHAALQKVFKSRFEEGRSHTRITNFADVRNKIPFIKDKRVSYEKLLGKNKESFYNTSFFTNNSFKVFNNFASSITSLNFYFFDFPFLLAKFSDASVNLWFDWYQKWFMVEVQPTPASKFTITGTIYPKKPYDFNYDQGEIVNAVETYFTRVARARKSYLPLWIYTPYVYTRSNVWSLEHTKILFTSQNTKRKGLKNMLITSSWFWDSLAYSTNTSNKFTPTFSNSHKSTWRPFSSIQSYYYNLSILTDILTQREHLYRQYFERNNRILNLPKTFTVSPNNSLLQEIRSSFLLIDPITYSSEYSRDFYYSSLEYFKFILFKDFALTLSNKLPLNTNLINEYLFFYLSLNLNSNKIGNNHELYKSQFKPLKKGISNMLRLQGTGAVAMPIEIRLQILASSKDVIHSWAIPSAGIKIDCIPGYTSHRIMIFFTPGIYWGQCMEICGRYHHWMPIIVYFMKRDLFFLWCTHFSTKSGINDTWKINDRQFADYIKFASYDRTTWLTELNNSL